MISMVSDRMPSDGAYMTTTSHIPTATDINWQVAHWMALSLGLICFPHLLQSTLSSESLLELPPVWFLVLNLRVLLIVCTWLIFVFIQVSQF